MPVNKSIQSSARLFLFIALFTTSSCTKPKPEETMVKKISDDSIQLSEEAIKNIKIEKVKLGEFPEQLSLMGRVSVPEDRVTVVPARVAGRIDAVYVASGEIVGHGQVMASIFSADYVIAREEYVQAIKQSLTGEEGSKHFLELSRRKLRALGVSDIDIDKLGTSGEQKSENLTVRAPRGGAILDKKAIIGNFVNLGDTLFTIGDMNKVWFAGDIYPEDLGKVHKSQDIVIDPGNGAPAIYGKISFISPVIDPSSRTIKVRALMENPGNHLRADMYVKGNLILSKRMALVAPKTALVRLRDSLFCFKRSSGNIFKRVPVTVQTETGNQVAISQGLNDGDEVVSEGGLLLDAALSGASGS